MHRNTKGVWRAPRKQFWVFRGSAISALLFIIYMGDVMEDNAAPNRRSNLPTRIAPDRPQGQASRIIWGTIHAQDKTEEQLQEQQIDRTIKRYSDKENEKQRIATFAQKRRRIRNTDTQNKRKYKKREQIRRLTSK